MKEPGFEVITILVVLLPGFFCSRMVQQLCVRRDQTELDKLVQALLYSFLIYVIWASLPVSPPVTLNVVSKGDLTTYSIRANTSSLLSLAGVAVALALLIATSETNDLLGRLLRRLGVTQRTTRPYLWTDVFHVCGGFVQVELEDERSVLGWVRLYSDDPDDRSLFLEHASWVDKNNKKIPIEGPGIYLTKDSGIRTIMFLRAEGRSETSNN